MLFRFALATFALLASTANAITCEDPLVISDGPQTVFYAGDNYSQETHNIDLSGATEAWFSLSVGDVCILDIWWNSCSTGSPPVVIEIYEEEPDVCTNLATSAVVADQIWDCNNPADQGKELMWKHNTAQATTYLIRVRSADGGTFDFPGEMELVAQGNLGQCQGDPHFRRWGHDVRDSFHGECDLVLFHNEVDGEDLDVHVRTTMKDSYSYVSGVAVKYGKDNIEFQHDNLLVNGAKPYDEELTYFGVGNEIVMTDNNKRRFKLSVKDLVEVEVHSTKHFMGVSIQGKTAAMIGSTGILGDYETGDMIARDGSKMDNFMDFGFEWQVSPSDPQIFRNAREPQLPYERCRMPSVTAEAKRRKLRGQDRKLYEQALAACTENHIQENIQSCVDDVMFTGELELAYDV